MARKPVVLSNGRKWTSQGEAKAHFRHIRDKYPENTQIDDPDDHDDLCALLERYDAAITVGPSKVGVGVDHFETRVNYANGGQTVGFWVVRTDGTETDFSFISAVAGSPKKEAEQFSDACREAIYEEVRAAKVRFFREHGSESGRVNCEITGAPIAIEEARLDYSCLGFQDIVWKFREAEGWHDAIPGGVLTEPHDGQTTSSFSDVAAMVKFRQFHRSYARMRVVAKSVTRSELLATRGSSVRNTVLLQHV